MLLFLFLFFRKDTDCSIIIILVLKKNMKKSCYLNHVFMNKHNSGNMILHLFLRNKNITGTGIKADFFGTRIRTEQRE